MSVKTILLLQNESNFIKGIFPLFLFRYLVFSYSTRHNSNNTLIAGAASGPDVVGLWGEYKMTPGAKEDYVKTLVNVSLSTIEEALNRRQVPIKLIKS